MDTVRQTFRKSHREFQELVRELTLVRKHNNTFKKGDSQDALLHFAEAALVLVALERFLRIVLGRHAGDRDTLSNLLRKATGDRHKVLDLPGPNREDAIAQIVRVRNTLLHGNYEQAAQEAGCSDVPHYFKTQFAPEIEQLYKLLDNLVGQIDPETGTPTKQPS